MAKEGDKRRFLGFVDDMVVKLRGSERKECLLLLELGGKKRAMGLGEVVKRIKREKAVKMTSGIELGFLRRWRGGGVGGGMSGGGGGGVLM